MILTISYAGENAQNIGYLFRKNPSRPQVFELNYGKAYVFYPEVSAQKTTIALLLDIDPVDLARNGSGLFDYVCDRPYVSSSFTSVAIARIFGSAMSGRSDEFQDLADAKLDLSATIVTLPCKSDISMLNRVFEPLGYRVSFERFVTDERFSEWGESAYINLTIEGKVRLSDLLRHIYVLIPVFDRKKHYWIGEDEVDKLLRQGEEWLKDHPEREFITKCYLAKSRSLANLALNRLREADDETVEQEEINKEKLSLNRQRLERVIDIVKKCGAKSVIDLGCGEGNLLSLLIKEPSIEKIGAIDVSYPILERAKEKIKYDRLCDSAKEKLLIFQGSLTYKDRRFEGYDAACVVEVIEHLDLSRLNAFERVLFEFARPRYAIVTTPNGEYNEKYENLKGGLRHSDHRFEWARGEFRDWANRVAQKHSYSVQFFDIGESDEKLGSPTQAALFSEQTLERDRRKYKEESRL
ncbi:MAG: 3' terminal RNA ribose 2'-O-methyltransferase Hen1 [Helicobacteraceae bacterium]|jgi:3' terminal RNA ribose 2'-O-methyltransferase Hen1|nr:3' terminal RNA ribose 2'-O-methyltransferase Hen1 [Helicobacteraceae bacterium]